MAKAETALDERFTSISPAFRGGDEPPFQRKLSPQQEEDQVWSVLEGRRPATPKETSDAWDIVRHSLQQTEAMRKADHGS